MLVAVSAGGQSFKNVKRLIVGGCSQCLRPSSPPPSSKLLHSCISYITNNKRKNTPKKLPTMQATLQAARLEPLQIKFFLFLVGIFKVFVKYFVCKWCTTQSYVVPNRPDNSIIFFFHDMCLKKRYFRPKPKLILF